MRLFVLFDLPTLSKKDRKYATKFRNYLVKEGFIMLQWSVYCRICNGQDSANRNADMIRVNLPPKGNVRMIQITEKQYERMELLIGEQKVEEKNGRKQLLLF